MIEMLSWYNHLDGAAQPPGPGHARAVVGRGGGGAAQVVGQRRHHQRLRAGRRDGGEGDRPALVAGLHPQYNPNIDPKDTSVSKCIVRTCAVPWACTKSPDHERAEAAPARLANAGKVVCRACALAVVLAPSGSS